MPYIHTTPIVSYHPDCCHFVDGKLADLLPKNGTPKTRSSCHCLRVRSTCTFQSPPRRSSTRDWSKPCRLACWSAWFCNGTPLPRTSDATATLGCLARSHSLSALSWSSAVLLLRCPPVVAGVLYSSPPERGPGIQGRPPKARLWSPGQAVLGVFWISHRQQCCTGT